MKRFIRSSSLSSINHHQFFATNKSQKPSFSNLSFFNPILLPQFPLFPNPKSNSLLTKQKKKSFSTAMSSASTNSTSDLYETPQILKPRTVVKKVLAQEQAEGVGATVRRSIGRPELRNFDPFLLLDYATFSPPAGFPDHPHRGFETVTYVLEGYLAHEDFGGHKGTIGPGDLQWMTAGRGILHSEMPVGNIANKGLQLWVNLSSKDKMIEPKYQELQSKDIKRVERDGIEVRIIAGEAFGVRSPIYTRTPTMYLDFTMSPGSELQQAIPEHWNAFLYIIEGEGVFGAEESAAAAPCHHTVVLSGGDGLRAWNKSGRVLRFMLIAGQPLNEAVVQYGPFVMNTREEIQQAFQDYQLCQNGFEKAKYWKRRA